MRTDGGGKYIDKIVRDYLNKLGIRHTTTIPYTPEQNGSAKRENRILVEAARSMLFPKPDLPQFLWAEAINCAAYVLNRTGTSKSENKTPYEVWFGKKASVDHLKVFGTECFVHIPKEKRQKLDKKAYKGYLIGYTENIKGYRIWIPELKDIVVSRDVLFKEERLSKTKAEIEIKHEHINDSQINDRSDCDYQRDVTQPIKKKTESECDRKLRDRSKLKRPDYFGEPIVNIANAEPISYEKAINSDDAENWEIVMKEEMQSLHENETYILVEAPRHKRVIQNQWVYWRKIGTNSSKDRYKARLVIKGCS